ncbi:hypothetical protein GCM10009624_13030 [Gordonia sinesedis]
MAAVASLAGAVGSRRAAAVTKPLPIALLAAHTARDWRSRPPLDNTLLAGVLMFSAAGDRAMLVEEFTESSPVDHLDRLPVGERSTTKDRRLACGASLFAGAQLCYAAVMLRRGARLAPRRIAPRMAILGESAAVIARHRPRLLGVLGPYGSTLATMSALAADLAAPQPQVRAGGWLFLASDLTILNRRHRLGNERLRRLAEVWVLASYFAAQALLLDGLSAPTARRTGDPD